MLATPGSDEEHSHGASLVICPGAPARAVLDAGRDERNGAAVSGAMFDSADAYERFIGRYGPALAEAHVAAAGVERGQFALDVGAGTGALTAVLADVLGAPNVAAVDPSEAFVAACAARVPGADIRVGSAEALPPFGRRFDVVLSQLVVNFVTDAEAGVRAMRAAAAPGGTVASCT